MRSGFDLAKTPMVVTDLDGQTLRMNAAMLNYQGRRGCASGGAPAGIVGLLDDAPEPAAMVYRGLRLAEAGAPFAEDLAGSRNELRGVSARPGGDGEVLWSFALAPSAVDPSPRRLRDDPVFEGAPVALLVLDRRGRARRANAEARRILGPLAETGTDLAVVLKGLGRPMKERFTQALSAFGAKGANAGWELTEAKIEGRQRFFRIELAQFVSPSDVDAALIASVTDATRLKTQEEQFVQSQKIQAVGQLAGGVAHDFNNLLTVINGQTEMILLARDVADPDYAALSEIHKTGLRASDLVRQLLAFSRRQMLQPQAVDPGESVRDLTTMLKRLVGERVRVRLELDETLWRVNVDPGQFEQTIVNLVVNARDAMPDGGEVLIRSWNRRLGDPIQRDGATVAPGDYVEIEVSDEGVGINERARQKIFEPFYTTKPVGEGTGLGLSTVYGVVKQTGGFIFCDSESGEGATFRILLPRCSRQVEAPAAATASREDLTGSASVLIVEDEAPVRMLAARALRQRGYQVTEADNPSAALALLLDMDVEVDVVVSDVVMPDMDGPTLVDRVRDKRPDMGVVFMSGYAEDMFGGEGRVRETDIFLTKPFALRELASAVKQALNSDRMS